MEAYWKLKALRLRRLHEDALVARKRAELADLKPARGLAKMRKFKTIYSPMSSSLRVMT
jgi:hypothetical protein